MTFSSVIDQAGFRGLGGPPDPSFFSGPVAAAILAPPLDTIPSRYGNAIYTISQELAAAYPERCALFSVWPEQGAPEGCSISDRILYSTAPLKPVPLEKSLPYRLKKILWGTGRPEMLHYARQAGKVCRQLGVETILVQDIPIYGWVLRKILGDQARIFLHQHINAQKSYSRFWWKRIERSLDGIAFVAKASLMEAEQRHGKISVPTTVVYNGLDLSHYDPERWRAGGEQLRAQWGIADHECVLLFVGRMIPGKGPAEAVEAFAQAGLADARFVLVGPLSGVLFQKEQYTARLKAVVEKSTGKAMLTGGVSQNDLPAYYAAADAVIVPSIQDEGLPKVITEALAMGKPVIASGRGGALELVTPGVNGWLISDPQDPRAFAPLLRQVLESRAALKEMSDAILIHSRPKLDFQNSLDQMVHFIQSVRTHNSG